MGSANVGLVYGRWGHLPDRSFRLLAYMALISMDEDDPPVFWQGRESLSMALGRMTPPAPAKGDTSERANQFKKARTADFEAVKSALRALFQEDVVRVAKECGPGSPTVYSLHLDAGTGKAEPVQRGRLSLSTGKAEPVQRGRLSLPPTTKEPKDFNPNPNPTQVTNSPAPVDNSAEGIEFGYAQAVEILQALPDLGGQYMTRAADIDGGLQAQIIAAAKLCISERNAS